MATASLEHLAAPWRRWLFDDALPLWTSAGINPATGGFEEAIGDDGRPVQNLNELEWVKGEIYADIWQTNLVARIDPASGHVVGWIDLAGLLPAADVTPGRTDVLNGIAYDAAKDRLFVTGKNWPKLFQITLQRRP